MTFPITEFSGMWEGDTVGDAAVEITHLIYNEIQRRIITGILRGDAAILWNTNATAGNELKVTESSPTGLSVDVLDGSAIVLGAFYNLQGGKQLSITANNDVSGDDRIDTVALEYDSTAQTIRLVVEEGTVAASPVPPTLTQSASLYQVRIADVTVQNGALSILNADIAQSDSAKFAKLATTAEGGVGINAEVTPYTKGDALIASDADTLEQVNIADFYHLIGKTSESAGVKGFDARPAIIFADTADAIGSSTPAIVPFVDADKSDPSGYLGTISSNAFTPAAGTYLVWGNFQVDSNATVRSINIWLASTGATTTPIAECIGRLSDANEDTANFVLPLQVITLNGSTQIAFYSEANGTLVNFGSTVNSTSLTGAFNRHVSFLKIN